MRLSILLPLVALAGCGKLTDFDVDLSASGVIRGSLSQLPGASEGFGGWRNAGAAVARTVENQGVREDDIRSARLTSGSIAVSLPEGGTLEFVESFSVFVEAPGLERRRLAHQDEAFGDARSSYPLVLDDVDLKAYIAAESMTLEPHITLHSLPMMDHEIDVSLVLHVSLDLF